MPADRYFTNGPFKKGASATLTDKEHTHLTRVMRKTINDTIELIDGEGHLAKAVIISIEKQKTTVEVRSVKVEPKPQLSIIIAQAIPRQNRLDTILEKCTELGATEFHLFPAAKSERVKFNPSQLERCQNVLIAAIKQSGSLYLPKLKLIGPITQWSNIPKCSLHGDLSPEAPTILQELKSNTPVDDQIMITIGPESGLTIEEIKTLARYGSQGIHLHHNTLRTDTAPIAALAQLWLYLRDV